MAESAARAGWAGRLGGRGRGPDARMPPRVSTLPRRSRRCGGASAGCLRDARGEPVGEILARQRRRNRAVAFDRPRILCILARITAALDDPPVALIWGRQVRHPARTSRGHGIAGAGGATAGASPPEPARRTRPTPCRGGPATPVGYDDRPGAQVVQTERRNATFGSVTRRTSLQPCECQNLASDGVFVTRGRLVRRLGQVGLKVTPEQTLNEPLIANHEQSQLAPSAVCAARTRPGADSPSLSAGASYYRRPR